MLATIFFFFLLLESTDLLNCIPWEIAYCSRGHQWSSYRAINFSLPPNPSTAGLWPSPGEGKEETTKQIEDEQKWEDQAPSTLHAPRLWLGEGTHSELQGDWSLIAVWFGPDWDI